MPSHKTPPSTSGPGGEAVRRRVLDAAERLLRDGRAEFSMRDLAAAAEVSFATPFNRFGSKAAIMHALSARRIDAMAERFAAAAQPADLAGRVLLAVDTAVAVMLEEPAVNRAVMGWIGTAGAAPGEALARSAALWTLAIGADDGSAAPASLPRQLALAFRGALSFWTAGELPDDGLGPNAREVAATLLRGVGEGCPTAIRS
ncbi:TetR/AcrR family transcriptional regulator [Lichenibacterium dinghuense]|uniref:TetR/AcrR family transcriptional regulator n=1 Tax=Lichenibacterium dinghuense TaxID=2895977 RepID=UPI001F42F3EA|nr:TetR/AcrR family transcriptional regulator [Lichenibacterium sp. 6Y81]